MKLKDCSYILGISAFYHDSAACLLRDGEIVAAAQEERFTRKKGDASFPRHAIEFCLGTVKIGIDDLRYVGFYDKPLLKFERILETYLGVAPRGFAQFLKAGPVWIKEKLFMKKMLRDSIEAGSIGLSVGLLYCPGCFSRTEEITEIASVLGFRSFNGRG